MQGESRLLRWVRTEGESVAVQGLAALGHIVVEYAAYVKRNGRRHLSYRTVRR